jgi:hypothetical protein
MKHVVLYSGGANSAYLAFLMAEREYSNTILLHTPTYSEHPDTDRFRKQFADYLDLPITVQSDGRDIWQLINDHHCLPSERIPFCSDTLKSQQSLKFYKTMTEDFIVYFGYGGKEWRRAQRSTARLQQLGIKSEYPLINLGVTDETIKGFIKDELKICLPEPYLYLNHNNCLPCFKGGKKHFYQIWKYYPEYFVKAIEAEDKIGHTVFKDKSLIELADQWQAQIPLFEDTEDLRPCMCAL